jgi:hypothetical protein
LTGTARLQEPGTRPLALDVARVFSCLGHRTTCQQVTTHSPVV